MTTGLQSKSGIEQPQSDSLRTAVLADDQPVHTGEGSLPAAGIRKVGTERTTRDVEPRMPREGREGKEPSVSLADAELAEDGVQQMFRRCLAHDFTHRVDGNPQI